MSTHLLFEQWVPSPVDRVFAFFSNPENLPRIMPLAIVTILIELNRMPPPKPLVGVASEKAAGAGSTIVTSFRVLLCSRFASGGSRASPSLNGIIISPMCRIRGHSKTGIIAMNSWRKHREQRLGRSSARQSTMKSASDFSERSPTHFSYDGRCRVRSCSARILCAGLYFFFLSQIPHAKLHVLTTGQ
jgi:hypothetical protein